MLSFQSTPPSQVTVSGGTVDANITNASVPISGSVDATIQNASLTVAGSVDIGTIAAGQVVEVINSPGAYIGTQSTATADSVSLTPAAGGGTASQSVTIPTSPPMHAALVSGVYTITAASNQSIQIQVTGNNTNTLYYNFDNLTTNVTNQAVPEAVIAVSAADTALVVSHVSGGGTQSSTININFYSQAIPPDPYVAALITQGLFGNTAETVINPQVSPPLLQSIYNNQISSNWGIKVADSVAPADSVAGVGFTNANATLVFTATTAVILRSATSVNATGIIQVFTPGAQGNPILVIPSANETVGFPGGMYVPANTAIYAASTAGNGYVFMTYTEL